MARSRWANREDAREEIVAAALRLYQQRSYPAVGMRDVADALHVGVATLYGHVRTKEELLAWAHLARSRQYSAALAEVGGTATDFEELFVGWSAAFYPLYLLTGIHVGAVLVRSDGRDLIGPEAAVALTLHAQETMDAAVGVVRRLLPPDAPETKASLIVELGWATMQGMADHYGGERHLLHRHSWRELATVFAHALERL